ncbi:DUF881 domain-containing protein [Blastococcus sp. TML/M2B]|uniref:DUF881 domain-containing protein n=1 Tax=unclassified Blastococcus TaxID=2619396 RepID=UPI00190B80E5|nr:MULTISPECIES: DUF881 domain-containing protein [unclassified Blastococcus]MBN1093086.1 DUF881 domain-containing protein [Blastococcus sp. TML/M2B]MBN1096794.1 DUF881 domain-containing protein [Blastococcus sp. TML/C7B]
MNDPTDNRPADDGGRPATPLEDASAPDAPAEDPAAEDAPAQDAPADEAPAETTPSGGRSWNRVTAGIVTAVLAVALGFGLVVQIRSTGEEAITGTTEDDLVRILDELDTREEQLRQQLAEREQAVEELSGSRTQSGSALAEAQRRAEALGIMAGTLPARGPGLRLLIKDPEGAVTPAVLLDAIQELRGAGAEAIEVDGVRVVVSSYVGGTPGKLTVDGRPLSSPYEVLAIGPPTDLEVALNVSGGVVADVARTGGTASVTQVEEISIDSLVDGG